MFNGVVNLSKPSRSIFVKRGNRSSSRNRYFSFPNLKKSDTLKTISEDEEDESSEMYKTCVQTCIDLLSSNDERDASFGLETLLSITADEGGMKRMSEALVYGGNFREEKLRQLIAEFLDFDEDGSIYDDDSLSYSSVSDDDSADDSDVDYSYILSEDFWRDVEKENCGETRNEMKQESCDETRNEIHIVGSMVFENKSTSTFSTTSNTSRNDGTLSDVEYSDNEDDDDDEFRIRKGNQKGVYYKSCIDLIFNALRSVSKSDDLDSKSIDFSEPFWKRVITSLVDNIETNYTAETTSSSLACFRLLHTLEPTYTEPFISQVLSPYLIYLRDSFNDEPKIHSEASRLLARSEQNYPMKMIETC